jgi:hypothetical protein
MQTVWVDSIDPLLGTLLHENHLGFTQNFEMLGDGLRAHRKLRGNLGGGQLSMLREQLDNFAPIWVGDGCKSIHVFIIKHLLYKVNALLGLCVIVLGHHLLL